jgi:hypothetical protein
MTRHDYQPDDIMRRSSASYSPTPILHHIQGYRVGSRSGKITVDQHANEAPGVMTSAAQVKQ